MSDTTTKILASTAAALTGFGVAWLVVSSRSSTANPSMKERRAARFPKDKWTVTRINHYFIVTRGDPYIEETPIERKFQSKAELQAWLLSGEIDKSDVLDNTGGVVRSMLRSSNPASSKPAPLIKYLENVDAYTVFNSTDYDDSPQTLKQAIKTANSFVRGGAIPPQPARRMIRPVYASPRYSEAFVRTPGNEEWAYGVWRSKGKVYSSTDPVEIEKVAMDRHAW